MPPKRPLLPKATLTVRRLGGIKSLYADSYFDPDEFWGVYGGSAYSKLKSRYDPKGRLSDL